jgi:hypothetical protein
LGYPENQPFKGPTFKTQFHIPNNNLISWTIKTCICAKPSLHTIAIVHASQTYGFIGSFEIHTKKIISWIANGCCVFKTCNMHDICVQKTQTCEIMIFIEFLLSNVWWEICDVVAINSILK